MSDVDVAAAGGLIESTVAPFLMLPPMAVHTQIVNIWVCQPSSLLLLPPQCFVFVCGLNGHLLFLILNSSKQLLKGLLCFA